MTSQAMIHGRIAWMDAAKGVGIVLVVVGHVLDGLFSAHILPRTGVLNLTYFAIYSFHMPLFFFLSGLHVRDSLARGRERFAISRWWTIVYPYLLWSAVQGSTQVIMSSHLNRPTTVADVLGIAVFPIGHFWFLYALALCHAVALLTSSRTGLMLGVAIAGLLLYRLAPNFLSLTCYYFLFYAIGVVFGPAILGSGFRFGRRGLGILVALFAAAATLVGAANGWRAVDVWMLPVSALGVAATVAACMLLSGRMLRVVAALGTVSLTIYLLHVMAAAGARILLVKLGFPPDPFLYIAVGIIAGIAGPVLFHLLMKRWDCLAVLGLAAPRTRLRATAA